MEEKAKYEVVVPPGQKRRRQIEDELQIVHTEVWQGKPYTAVKVDGVWQGMKFTVYGFSKVCRPDKWDPDRGIELATQKAIAKITKEIVRHYFGDEKGAQ